MMLLRVALLLGLIALEPEHARAGRFGGEGILLVAGDAADAEALGVDVAALAVAVDHGVDGLLVALEEATCSGFLPDEELWAGPWSPHVAVAGDEEHLIDGAALVDGLAFLLQAVAGEAVLRVEIERLGGDRDLGGGRRARSVAISVLRSRPLPYFFFRFSYQPMAYCVRLLEVLLASRSMSFSSASDLLVGLEGVELGDALDFDLGEAGRCPPRSRRA